MTSTVANVWQPMTMSPGFVANMTAGMTLSGTYDGRYDLVRYIWRQVRPGHFLFILSPPMAMHAKGKLDPFSWCCCFKLSWQIWANCDRFLATPVSRWVVASRLLQWIANWNVARLSNLTNFYFHFFQPFFKAFLFSPELSSLPIRAEVISCLTNFYFQPLFNLYSCSLRSRSGLR